MKSKLTSHRLVQRSIYISVGNITGSLNTHSLVTHRKSPEVFLVKEPGPLGTASDTVITSKPTLNDLQSQHNTVDHECHSPDRTTFPVAQHATHELFTSHSTHNRSFQRRSFQPISRLVQNREQNIFPVPNHPRWNSGSLRTNFHKYLIITFRKNYICAS